SQAKPENFSRLQQEHARALKGSQETIKKWEQFKYDYEVLQARLHTLPDKLTHDIMVPFGQFGFMRGHLYHTNEVMVLLGDNWFAQRTAKQAVEIAEHRKKYVCEMLEKEKKVMEDLQARSSFVSELSAAALQVARDGFEIREEYDAEEEARRKESKRRERERRGIVVPPPRPAFPRQTGVLSKGQGEERKREEGEEREMKEGENQREMELWAALEKKEAEEEEKREEGEKEEEEEGGKEEEEKELKGRGSVERGKTHQAVATITFSHTAGPDTGPSDVSTSGVEELVYSTPGDIARCHGGVAPPRETGEGEEGGGKRGVRWDPNLVRHQQEKSVATPADVEPLQVPISQLVREKDSLPPNQQVSSRKVSKFKLSRSSN
ncbi:Unconventional prefoldin RPB5 interactor, partial [Geodia barretti]